MTQIKNTIIIFTVLLFCLSTAIFYFIRNNQKSRTIERLTSDLQAQGNEITTYKNEKGLLTAKIVAQEYTLSEIKKGIAKDVVKELKNLGIKEKHFDSYSETVINNQKEIIRALKDSIIFDTVKIKKFDYKDTFYDVRGQIINDSIKLNINSTDSIIQVVYRGRRYKPYLWIFSKRRLEQVVYSKNPNSKIKFQKYLRITKQ